MIHDADWQGNATSFWILYFYSGMHILLNFLSILLLSTCVSSCPLRIIQIAKPVPNISPVDCLRDLEQLVAF